MAVKIDEDGALSYDVWYRPGNGMMYHRDALEPEHPECTYNYLLANGITPEEYGFTHPQTEEFNGKSRADLIKEIVSLRKELESWIRHNS